MKTLAILILMLVAAVPRLSAQADRSAEENSLMNCMLRVRFGLEKATPAGMAYDYTAYVDTLYRYLYAQPVQAGAAIKLMAKLTLQAYFIGTGDARTDWEDTDRTLRVAQRLPSIYDIFFVTCANGMALHLEEAGRYADAIQRRDWALLALPKVLGAEDTPMAYLLLKQNEALSFQQVKDYQRAARYSLRACRISEALEGDTSSLYREDLQMAASVCHVAGLWQEADSCFALVQTWMEREGQQSSTRYAQLLLDRADACQSMGLSAYADSCYQRVLSPSVGAGDALCREALYGLASLRYGRADYEGMLPPMQRLIGLMEQDKSTAPGEVFRLLDLCNAPNVGAERKRLLALARRMERKDDVPSLATLAYAYRKNYDYDRSSALCEDVARLMDSYAGAGDTVRFEAGLPYVQTLFVRGKYQEKCTGYLWHSLRSTQRQFGAFHPLVLELAALIASQYVVSGDYRRATHLADSCLALPDVAGSVRFQLLRTKADALTTTGQFVRAIGINRQALPLARSTAERWDVRAHGIVGNLMAELDLHRTNRDEAFHPGTDSLAQVLLQEARALADFAGRQFGVGNQEHILALEYLASACYLAGQQDEMLQTALACEDLIRRHVRNEELKAVYLECLAPFHIYARNYRKAYSLIDRKSLEEDDDLLFAERHSTLTLLAETTLGMGRLKDAQAWYTRQAEGIIAETGRNFASLTAAERNRYWRMYRQYIYDAGKFITDTGKPSRFAGTVYDLALFSKGLLLNSSRQLERLIAASHDEDLMRSCDELNDLRGTLVNTPSLLPAERAAMVRRTDELEADIIRRAQAYGDYTRYIRTRWQDVRDRLGEKDIAIEFIDYMRQDSTEMYGALLLGRKWDEPIFVPLVEKSRYDSLATSLSIDAVTSDPVWKPLMPFLAGTEDIYFAPTGILHKLPIEYMPCPGDSLGMSERFRMYRLSSTRVLAELRREKPEGKAVLYGGLEYDATLVMLNEADSRQGRVLRLPYLQGTEQEVEAIAPLMQGKHVKFSLYTGEDGTEESFKALSGQPVSLIHLATHGYYLPLYDDALEQIPSLRLSATMKDEDRTLLNAAVCMAGINNAHLASDLDTSDDGYLSAKEIAAMDLQGTDLVVLSACLTAEGEVTGEGVFGLQRGFKQAGAGTLLMSCWKVDDQATRLLMTSFYTHLLRGESKREAFVAAQKELRANDKYNDSRYWAAFILLDGI